MEDDERISMTNEEIAVAFEKLTSHPYEPVRNREDSPPLSCEQILWILAACAVIWITVSAAF